MYLRSVADTSGTMCDEIVIVMDINKKRQIFLGIQFYNE